MQDKERYSKAEDVVRLCELLGRSYEDLAEHGARLGGKQGEALHDSASAMVGGGAWLGGKQGEGAARLGVGHGRRGGVAGGQAGGGAA